MCIELLVGSSYIFSFASMVAKLLLVSHSAVFALHVLLFFHLSYRMIITYFCCVAQNRMNHI